MAAKNNGTVDVGVDNKQQPQQQKQQQQQQQGKEQNGVSHRASSEIPEENADTQSTGSGAKAKMSNIFKRLLIVKKVFVWMYRIITSHGGLMLILIGYSFAGAYLFEDVEGPHEDMMILERQEIIDNLTLSQERLAFDLWNSSKNASIGKEEWLQWASGRLEEYKAEIREAYENGVSSNSTGEKVWTMPKTMIYVITIYTTIGELILPLLQATLLNPDFRLNRT